jgi:hypothetical protein
MRQEDINKIEDDAEREKAQRQENKRVTEELNSMSPEELAAFVKARGYHGGL